MLSENVTVCIFAWNEEARIRRCLQNFEGLFRILVIDNCSTDRTVQVVAESGHRSISVKNPGFIETPEVMDSVIDACDTDYILIASVSEFVPMVLLHKYAEVAERQSHDVVIAFRESITAGRAIPISGRPSRRSLGEVRFFRKRAVDYSGNEVHGRGRIIASADRVLSLVAKKDYFFFQFRDYDCSHTEYKHRGYNDVLAKQRFDRGVRFSWLRMMVSAGKHFMASYVRYGSWRYGTLGFIHSYHRWQMEVGIWFRIWEWEHELTLAGVVRENDAFRSRLEARSGPGKI